ncbi:hypothetical protein B9479_005909 [Cryptococcus floricola]|uniref:Uncharacterized protein n=1 Tax=Cryptococcus floricola TaxID=2591691 RepID=A0A5D3APT5_9TREE|nr:hypothetical protein B9479_005909 [Cryptococcus floricola]
MPGSKYESSSSYHKGGTSASSTYNDDGSVYIAPSETPSQLDDTTTGASRMTRSEYIARYKRSRQSRQARLQQEEMDEDPTFKPDQSALSSQIPMSVLNVAPRHKKTVKTEDTEAAREELTTNGYTIMTTDIEAGYTTLSYVDTPLVIKEY